MSGQLGAILHSLRRSGICVCTAAVCVAPGLMRAQQQDSNAAKPTAEIVLETSFADGPGPFSITRGTPADVTIADGMLSLSGHRDGTVRSMVALFGLPLAPGGSIRVRQRADADAYGGLYILAGKRNVVQLGIGQGPGREGLLFELDNHLPEKRQSLYPKIGSKQDWHEYLITFTGDTIALSVDGHELLTTTYSGLAPDRIAIWNGMHSKGCIQTDMVAVHWLPPPGLNPATELVEEFATPTALQHWRSDAAYPEWQIVEDAGAADGKALHCDFRRQGRWSLPCSLTVRLEPRTAYRLRMRLRALSGVMGLRLSLHSTGSPVQARIDSRATRGYIDREATFVTGSTPCLGSLLLEGTWGGGTVWIDRIALEKATPPPSPYDTGVNLLHATLQEPGNRVGLVLEAEDTADAADLSLADLDGDWLWARLHFSLPEQVICDIATNPWGFSNNTVLKSDLLPGGRPARLRFSGIVPGRYRVFLSDPRRPAAVRLNGEDWRHVEGGREAFLGVHELNAGTHIQVAHRYPNPGNPGPIYLDYLRLLPVHDEAAIAETAQRVHAARIQARKATRQQGNATFPDITLTLREPAGIPRRRESVITGIPFARGMLYDNDRVRLVNADDTTPVPCDAVPLAHWPDGSVKWLRLRFRCDMNAGGERRVNLSGDAAGVPLSLPSPALDPGLAQPLETGFLRLDMGPAFIHSLALDSSGSGTFTASPPWDGEARLRLALGSEPAQTVPLRIHTYSRLPQHLAGTLVEFRGDLAWDGPAIGVQGRLLLDAERPVLSVDFWLVNQAAAPRLDLREATLILPFRGPAGPVTVGLADGMLTRPLMNGLELRQRGQGQTIRDFVGEAAISRPDGTREWRGERLAGWLSVEQAPGGIALGLREFSERHPKALAILPRQGGIALEVRIVPPGEAPFTWNQGVALAQQVVLAFPGVGDPHASLSLLAGVLRPLRAIPPPDILCRSGAFGTLQPLGSEPLYPEYEAEVDRAFALIAGQRSSYGMEDFGGVFQPGGYVPGTERMWTNMEYDFSNALLSQFARTGNPALLERADQATRHFVPVDIIHWSTDSRRIGGSHTHSHTMVVGHQVEGPNFGHGGWPQGPFQLYCLTGERQGLDAARLLGDYIVRHAGARPADDPGRPPYGLREERDAGNALLTCSIAYEATADPRFLEAAYRILDWVERCQVPGRGNWGTPITEDPPHRGTTFMVHQLYKGLEAMQQVTDEPRISAIFRRHAAWLLQEAQDQRGRFAFKYSPRYWRGASPRNLAWYALGFERAAAVVDAPAATRLRQQARAGMDALFGADMLARNTLIETDSGDRSRTQSFRIAGGTPGVRHTYTLTVRGTQAALAVDGEPAWEGDFSGQPARWLRFWSGMASVGTIAVQHVAVDRLNADGAVQTLLQTDFSQGRDLGPWRPRLPAGSQSQVCLAVGGLQLIDTDRALIGAELDLPPDLGPNYRLRWQQAMPPGQYGGLMLFGPGDFDFDLYRHAPAAMLHVGLNQAGSKPGEGLFNNPRSFAPMVTYLNQLIGALERVEP